MEIISWLDKGISYVSAGLDFVRDIVSKIAGVVPAQSALISTLIFLFLALWLGYLLSRRFVVKPLQFPYILYYLLISLSLFLNLLYL